MHLLRCYTDNKAGASENVYLRKALYITGDGTNNESEFAAVYHSLLQATGDQLQYLDIHTDSELVVNCVTGHCELTEPTLRPYLHAICPLLSRTTAWRISHIHRDANSEATTRLDRHPARGRMALMARGRASF